ncbi:MAG: polyamine aminopropyltransferase [Thermofilum sp.]|nr:polyamine aminopropyltransferase [Thermofilum sp.]MCC6065458.1 polyamine aminopropyltransferase [Thermofilum sp.]
MKLGVNIVQGIGRSSAMIVYVTGIIAVKRSKYQRIEVVDTEEFGRALVLDGFIQSTELDEHIYHESLVQPAMVLHPEPKRVLVLGGGEGATLREVLKHRTVERAVMVDIDEDVVNIAKQHLGSWHRGAFEDKRAEVVIEDGKAYVERTKERFDVVVMDLTDPYGSEIARELYAPEFIAKLRGILREGGVVVTQAGSSFFYPDVYDAVLEGFKRAFRHVHEYAVWIPSFGYACNFIVASDTHSFDELSSEEIDRRLRERGVETEFVDGKLIKTLLALPIPRPRRRR